MRGDALCRNPNESIWCDHSSSYFQFEVQTLNGVRGASNSIKKFTCRASAINNAVESKQFSTSKIRRLWVRGRSELLNTFKSKAPFCLSNLYHVNHRGIEDSRRNIRKSYLLKAVNVINYCVCIIISRNVRSLRRHSVTRFGYFEYFEFARSGGALFHSLAQI